MKRVATALVAIACFLLANHNQVAFELLVLLCAAVAATEFARLSRQPALGVSLRSGWLVALVLLMLLALTRLPWWWSIASLGLLLPTVHGWSEPVRALRSLGLVLIALLWLGAFPAAAVFLRRGEHGESSLIWLLLIVALGDAAAFYAGSALGRRKLASKVSPHKTVEGSLAGLLASGASGLIVWWTFFPAQSPYRLVTTGVVCGAAGQLGDLFESLYKRAAGVKDSGAWLPGHGGLLDRIDATLFAAPMLLWLRSWALPT